MSKRRRVEGEVGSRRDVPSANESGEIPEDILAQLEKLERAYEDVNGYHVSRRAREELRAERQFDKLENLTYGEIALKPFAAFFLSCGIDLKRINQFSDLGSGTGKAVLVAAILLPHLKKSIGIEILPGLHGCAIKAKKRVDEWLERECQVEFCCADIFENKSWLASDLVFVTTTCFTDEAMEKLEKSLQSLKDGAFVMTATRRLRTPAFELQQKTRLKYAKGSLVVYIWRKKETQSSR